MREVNNPAQPATEKLCHLLARKLSGVAFLILSCVAFPSQALINAVDNVPASTLLFPYFEVDLDNPNGVTTVITITNTSATALLAHMTFWTDLGVPVFAFDTYLTGFDLAQINLRDILVSGTFPQDASDGQDPQDKFSPQGPVSQDINFASCTYFPKLPLNATWTLPTSAKPYLTSIDSLQKELTGKSSTRQTTLDPNSKINCVAHDFNDRIARGYLTVDTVRSCNQRSPADAAEYFDVNNGILSHQNVMVGDYAILNPTTNQLQLGSAAAIEATIMAASGMSYSDLPAGDYSFYGRYAGWSPAADRREPLASNWIGLGAVGHVDAMVWRDTKQAYTSTTSFACPAGPANGVPWQPLTAQQLIAFDTQEGTSVPNGTFSYATGRYGLGAAIPIPIPSTGKLGWFFGNFNPAPPTGGTKPDSDPSAQQSFVTFMRRPEGSAFSGTSGAVGYNVDNPNSYSHLLIQ